MNAITTLIRKMVLVAVADKLCNFIFLKISIYTEENSTENVHNRSTDRTKRS
jgi:hypothetical protein